MGKRNQLQSTQEPSALLAATCRRDQHAQVKRHQKPNCRVKTMKSNTERGESEQRAPENQHVQRRGNVQHPANRCAH